MKLLALLQGKILVAAAAGTLLVGGATAAFAYTPAGQQALQTLTHAKVTATATHDVDKGDQNEKDDQGNKACPGSPDAQKLATSFHLSTDTKGATVTAICALHQGTFKGTSTTGTAVTTSHAYGYGEIDQLLTYAQYLATHDKTNASSKLTDANVSSYLATALHSCGSSPLEKCLKDNIPNFHPGDDNHDGNNTGDDHKPTGTPMPDNNKPTGTPTAHH